MFSIVAVATNDFTIISESDRSTELLKQKIHKHWGIMDLGPISWLLGMKITYNLKAKTISLSQQSYVEQILVRFQLENAQPAITPLKAGVNLSPESSSVLPTLLTPLEKRTYHEMIGSLMYATIMTHPDLAFAVSMLSQYLESPWTTPLRAVTQVFRYLLGTKKLKLILGGMQNKITGYSDANWALHIHHHSISGFIYFISAGIVSWSCKKQPIVTLSSTEAEYVALMHASKDILWIHKLLTELAHVSSFSTPTTLFCDNQGAIQLSHDSTFHGHTHINIHFHFICQTIFSGHITLKYCPTFDMIADMFTKSLATTKFERFLIVCMEEVL